MQTIPYIELNLSKQPPNTVKIEILNAINAEQYVKDLPVNIYASGPSIATVAFDNEVLSTPSFFVNGSIRLTSDHPFEQVAGYVISDARFIEHNSDLLNSSYQGQPFYATLPVLQAIAKTLPSLLERYHDVIRVIYPVDRPLNHKYVTDQSVGLLKKLTNSLTKKITAKKRSLLTLVDHEKFVIHSAHKPKPIGVTLDITEGFVEAGTVAYVASQLAFTLGATEINLYGIDLINSQQPRFYEDKHNTAPSKLDKAVSDRIVPSFNLLGAEYKKRGVQVINHSVVSKNLFDNDVILPAG